jgi:hypothetical protein
MSVAGRLSSVNSLSASFVTVDNPLSAGILLFYFSVGYRPMQSSCP